MISRRTKQWLIAIAAILVTAACAFWIYRTEFAAPKFNLILHQAVGRVMAEETSLLLGDHGSIVIIAMEFEKVPEMRIQIEEFKNTLERASRIKVRQTYMLETEKQPKYGLGSGLSGRRYVRIVNKNASASAIVSFVGAPSLTDEEIGQLTARPKLIAEARSAAKLKPLFEKQVLHTAIVGRFEFPGPVQGKPHTHREWFDQRFQVVTAANTNSLPTASGE